MRPKIAVLMDENTSSGGTRYEAHKGYFQGVLEAGGAPFGIPYAAEMISSVVAEFDGLLAVGGRFAYPDAWYIDGSATKSPPSPRFEVERSLMTGFLAAKKPVLGICAGMQMLACLHGGRLTSDIAAWQPSALPHDQRDRLHAVAVHDGTLLRRIVGAATLQVNTFHREAIAEVRDGIVVSAHAEDGIVEAVELRNARFALGVQWHQELLGSIKHPANRIFDAFVEACRGGEM